MRYLVHALVISTFLLGSDYVANDGAETAKTIRDLELGMVWREVKAQQDQVAMAIQLEAQKLHREAARYRYRPAPAEIAAD